IGLGAVPAADGTGATAASDDLPECADSAGPAPPPGGAPAPGRGPACRARASRTLQADRGLPRPAAGYHHLGATSCGEWSGVLGRIAVADADVRPGTHDFVATRFLAKRYAPGRIAWLEAGWAETGWSGGRQRVYTYDTTRNAWTFYDQYAVRAGDRIWIYLHTAAGGVRPVWQAWLWWSGEWHLLAAAELPLGDRAQVEQYVEVFVDPRHGGRGFPVPPISLDNVQVKTHPGGGLRAWRETVATEPAASGKRYCVDWRTHFDAWSAGDCPAA
ncbi:MAG TPA: hypothetical protein VFR67_07585, partial [Pilimelia sp.]|nr:hypothetical protein [Pilimelia sp.]